VANQNLQLPGKPGQAPRVDRPDEGRVNSVPDFNESWSHARRAQITLAQVGAQRTEREPRRPAT